MANGRFTYRGIKPSSFIGRSRNYALRTKPIKKGESNLLRAGLRQLKTARAFEKEAVRDIRGLTGATSRVGEAFATGTRKALSPIGRRIERKVFRMKLNRKIDKQIQNAKMKKQSPPKLNGIYSKQGNGFAFEKTETATGKPKNGVNGNAK